jgi:glycosyltransferase involved in cell wall biosynthesis
MGADDTPLVSVVIAVRDGAATLPACLAALASQDYPNVEVIVVDDGSRDGTADLARAAEVRLIQTPGTGASIARNLGIEAARGAVVAFTDGDCVADPRWVRSLAEGLAASGATGIGGRQVNVFPPGRRRLREALDAFFGAAAVLADYTRGDERPRFVTHNASCCSAYRVEALRAVGGFRPGLWPGEDVDLDLRLSETGATFYYVPSAIVYHHRPGTFAWFRRMMRRYGDAERRLVRLHGRRRAVDFVPAVLALLIALQIFWLVPPALSAIAAFDAVIGLCALGVLWSTTPVRLWPAVIVVGVAAVLEWHRGWWTSRGVPA